MSVTEVPGSDLRLRICHSIVNQETEYPIITPVHAREHLYELEQLQVEVWSQHAKPQTNMHDQTSALISPY